MTQLIDDLLAADGDEAGKLARLEGLSPDDWLTLDHAARHRLWSAATPPHHGPGDELAYRLADEPGTATTVLAAMASSGYLREAATRRLADDPTPVATRALALRTTDHVASVRRVARAALAARAEYRTLWGAMPLLLRLSRRVNGNLDWFLAAEASGGRTQPGRLLTSHPDRLTRRWGFAHSDLDAVEALRLLHGERDQHVVATLVGIVVGTGKQTYIVRLLTARQSRAREAAILALPAERFRAPELRRMLLDKAARVRAAACVKLSQRGESAAEVYRELWHEGRAPRALAGLVSYGTLPLDEVRPLLTDSDYRIRRAALRLLQQHSMGDGDVALLWQRFDLASGPPEDKHIAWVLATVAHRWDYEELLRRWPDASRQRRLMLWQLGTQRGGWDRVRASLLAATDPDLLIRGAGINRLRTGWARLWQDPDKAQLADLHRLLPQANLPHELRHDLEWRIGLVDRSA
ncbi:MAG: hypothetical protein Q4D79_10040 [Propionibacteriaceae bacterium]|nr:hypothetical protein [Propionibacteriaceae bacterium]